MGLLPLRGWHMKRWITIFLAALTSACSSQVLLRIDSQPAGASVYQDGVYWGESPVTLVYTPSTEYANGGCMGTKPIMVQWDSGAQARVNTLNLCASSDSNRQFTFNYPEGFADATGEGAGHLDAARRVAPNGQLFYEVPGPGNAQPKRCYSDVNGSLVRTTCG